MVSGVELTITAMQQGIKAPLLKWNKGAVCCERTSQSAEGEDRPLEKDRRTVPGLQDC